MGKCCEMKGFLSFIVLRLISQKSMCGDEIRNELKKRKGRRPSSGTIYPVLKSMSQSKLIKEIKSYGKVKKYEITKTGRKELAIATKKFCEIFYDLKDDLDRCGCQKR